jgi:peptidoglycan/xylan/chitin deacetylase (PgdA/CDA1 family)
MTPLALFWVTHAPVMSTPRAVLSVDLESFQQLPAYRTASGSLDGTDAERALGISVVDGLCDRLAAHDAEATFFVVGELAERYPDTVATVADAGHEIASHTHTHRNLSELATAERRTELERSRETLERVTGAEVTGFRAPSFDVPDGHFAAVAAAGYGYDSSVVPCRSIPGWYGGEWSARRPCTGPDLVDGAPRDIEELPVAVMPGLRLPLTGAWLRLFGVRYALLGMSLLASQGITPVLYVHPWEFCSLPDVAGVPRRVYARTGGWMWRALDRLLGSDFEFVTARSALAAAEL